MVTAYSCPAWIMDAVKTSLCSEAEFRRDSILDERRYYQKNILPSHLFRLGLHLFGDKETVCRRRLFCCEGLSADDQSDLESRTPVVKDAPSNQQPFGMYSY